MLQIYADESGTHHPKGAMPGSEVPVVAGYIALCDDWAKFCRDWQAVLNRHKLTYFHAKEFESRKVNPNSPYRSWSDGQAERFKYALAEIAGRNIPVGGAYNIKEHLNRNPGDRTYLYEHPIRQFFGDVMDALAEWGYEKERLSFVFDANASKQWKSAIADEVESRKKAGARICSHAYGDDKVILPLQAADMLSHRARTRFLKKLQQQAGWNTLVEVPANVFDVMLSRNLHPNTGFRPTLTSELTTETSKLVKEYPSVKRALKEVPNNYFRLK